MNTNEMIQAWKNAEVEMIENNPVVVNEELMLTVNGGNASAGHVCSVSGECNSSGESCGNIIRKAFDILSRGLW